MNLLPKDGLVRLREDFLGGDEATKYYERLSSEIPWKPDEVVMFGRRIVTARRVAWIGDQDRRYRYSGVEREPLPWTSALRELKRRVEAAVGATFNSCLLNFYRDGGEGMGWHRDSEPALVPQGPIASVSLGARRRFDFKHRETGEKVSVWLENGSLLVMAGTTQERWLHALPKSKRVLEPRINLTFRQIREDASG